MLDQHATVTPSPSKSQPLLFLHGSDGLTPNTHALTENLQDELYFFCRDCDRPGYQPFLLSNTSGLEFYIKQTTDMNASGNTVFTYCTEAPQSAS